MLVLSRPTYDDAKALVRLGRDPRFTAHLVPWTQAYAQYERAGGDPWAVTPAVFAEDIGQAQRALYDTRRNSSALRRIRRRPDFSCCPMCGSGTRGHLDHFLPRTIFPEFSVFGLNLVPTCASCNSSNKGETYRGVSPERFLHPYFDTLAASAIWFVEIRGDLRAAQFAPRATPSLSVDDTTRVAFHLANVLGWEFDIWAANTWAGLPQLVRDAHEDADSISASQARRDLEQLHRQAVGTDGRNSWPAALYRGVLDHPSACDHIAVLAMQRVPTTV